MYIYLFTVHGKCTVHCAVYVYTVLILPRNETPICATESPKMARYSSRNDSMNPWQTAPNMVPTRASTTPMLHTRLQNISQHVIQHHTYVTHQAVEQIIACYTAPHPCYTLGCNTDHSMLYSSEHGPHKSQHHTHVTHQVAEHIIACYTTRNMKK